MSSELTEAMLAWGDPRRPGLARREGEAPPCKPAELLQEVLQLVRCASEGSLDRACGRALRAVMHSAGAAPAEHASESARLAEEVREGGGPRQREQMALLCRASPEAEGGLPSEEEEEEEEADRKQAFLAASAFGADPVDAVIKRAFDKKVPGARRGEQTGLAGEGPKGEKGMHVLRSERLSAPPFL